MSGDDIRAGVVAYLSSLSRFVKPHTGEMRKRIGCGVAELRDAIEAMRAAGELASDKLQLATPSSTGMVISEDSPDTAADTAEPGESATLGALPPEPADAPAERPGEGDAASLTANAASPDDSTPAGETPGLLLLRAIETYCEATDTPESRIGKMLFNYPGFVGLLRKRGTVVPEKIRAVCGLMAEYPRGVPAEPAQPVEDVVAVPAEVAAVPSKREARPARPLNDLRLSTVEAIQTLVAETPEDLIRTVGRKHPQFWRRCVRFGRATDETPAATLYRAIGAGLDVLEETLNEEMASG